MSLANSLHAGLGNTKFPVTPKEGDSFASLNPGRDILLLLIAAAINAELADRWGYASAGTTLSGRQPVQTTVPDEPDEQLIRELKVQFPALFVYQSGDPSPHTEFTLAQDQRQRTFHLDYILGPHDVGERRKLKDVLVAVDAIIDRTLKAGGHRAYHTTVTAGLTKHATNVLTTPEYAGFSRVEIPEPGVTLGIAAFSEGGPKYFALSCPVLVTERSNQVAAAGAVPYQGTTLHLGTGDSTGIIHDLIQAESPGDATAQGPSGTVLGG